MHVRRRLLACIAFLVFAPSLLAAENPWFGTWKLNRAKSTMTGDTYTIGSTGEKYSMDFGAVKFTFKDDGQDYPAMPSRTVSLRSTGNNQWLQIWKTNGQETSRTTMALSPDGNTLTSHTTGTHADGSTYTKDATDTRVGTGKGLTGTWRTTAQSSTEPETLIYSDAGEGAMRMDSTESRSTIITHFDGQPASETGPHAVPGRTLAIKAVSPTSYSWILAMDGKPYVQGINTLSPDGSQFKEVNWLVTRPAETYIMIYERQ